MQWYEKTLYQSYKKLVPNLVSYNFFSEINQSVYFHSLVPMKRHGVIFNIYHVYVIRGKGSVKVFSSAILNVIHWLNDVRKGHFRLISSLR